MFGDRYAIDMDLLQASHEWHGLSLSARGVYITMLPHMITSGPFVGVFAERESLQHFDHEMTADWVVDLCGYDPDNEAENSQVVNALTELLIDGFIKFVVVAEGIERPRAVRCHLIKLGNSLDL